VERPTKQANGNRENRTLPMLTNLKRQNRQINAGALLLALQTIENLFGVEDRAVPRGAVTDRRQEFGELAQPRDRPVCRAADRRGHAREHCRMPTLVGDLVSAYCACALAGSSS
jgi:hypothetical protein